MGIQFNGNSITIDGKTYAAKLRMYVATIAHDAVAGSTATGTAQIDPSSPFVLTALHVSDTNDPTTAAPGLDGQYENSLSVQDQANNYNWSSDYVPRSAFAGGRKMGRTLDCPIVVERNTRLAVSARNPSAGSAAGTTTVTFIGYSIY